MGFNVDAVTRYQVNSPTSGLLPGEYVSALDFDFTVALFQSEKDARQKEHNDRVVPSQPHESSRSSFEIGMDVGSKRATEVVEKLVQKFDDTSRSLLMKVEAMIQEELAKPRIKQAVGE